MPVSFVADDRDAVRAARLDARDCEVARGEPGMRTLGRPARRLRLGAPRRRVGHCPRKLRAVLEECLPPLALSAVAGEAEVARLDGYPSVE